jgi:hypothetical protein
VAPLEEEMPLDEEIPLDEPVLVFPHVADALPLIDCVAPPCVHVMVQLVPLVVDEHV